MPTGRGLLVLLFVLLSLGVLTGVSSADVRVAHPIPGDFDGDNRSDLAVWRPSNGTWYVRGMATVQWGLPGDVPVAGDYFGSQAEDVAVWRPSNGFWYVQGDPNPPHQWGAPTDVPVPGDYNGDSFTDRAVWRPSTGTWYVEGVLTEQWGLPTDIPVPGDYDGNGTTDIAVWRPSTGVWYVKGGLTQQWGAPTDIPVPGNYDGHYNGDGRDDIAVWRPSTGVWYVRFITTEQWGAPTDIPVPGDYNGNGGTDVAVWRPSTGRWYNAYTPPPPVQWGDAADIPIERPTSGLVPFNDMFAAAQVLATPSGNTTGLNGGATREAGEPLIVSNQGGKSVWYQWTAPSNGSLSVSTTGSTFDTILGVYTGTAVNALTLPGPGWQDDDSGGSLTSRVGPLPVTAGTTYRIAVDGFNFLGSGASQGAIALSWTFTQ